MTRTISAGAWTVDTRRGDDALDDLADEWTDLYHRSAVASPFQSYAWVRSWWRAYGRAGRLRVFLVRQHGRLVAAAAFQARGPVLAPLGGDLTDFTDVLLDDRAAVPAARALTAALLRDPGWQVVDLPESRRGAALVAAWPGGHHETAGSVCLDLPARPMDELVAALPPHTRKTVRRRLNQLRKAGPEIRETTPGEAPRAIDDLLRLHRRQWQGRGGNPGHRTPAFAAHLTSAIPGMIRDGQAALLEYRFAGDLLASSLLLIGRDLVGGYLYGADPVLRGRVDVTTMLLADALALAHRWGRPTMSMLRGAEPHKATWRPAAVANRRLLLTRPGSLRGAAYAHGVLLHRRAVTFAGRRAPWLRTVRDRLRGRR